MFHSRKFSRKAFIDQTFPMLFRSLAGLSWKSTRLRCELRGYSLSRVARESEQSHSFMSHSTAYNIVAAMWHGAIFPQSQHKISNSLPHQRQHSWNYIEHATTKRLHIGTQKENLQRSEHNTTCDVSWARARQQRRGDEDAKRARKEGKSSRKQKESSKFMENEGNLLSKWFCSLLYGELWRGFLEMTVVAAVVARRGQRVTTSSPPRSCAVEKLFSDFLLK